MKKIFGVIALMATAAFAQAQNVFSIADFNIEPGETKTIEINLENADVIEGFQFDLVLSEGLTYEVESYDTADRTWLSKKDNWTISEIEGKAQLGTNEDGMQFAAFTTGTPLNAGKGAIMVVNVKASATFKEGKVGIINQIASYAGKELPSTTIGAVASSSAVGIENIAAAATATNAVDALGRVNKNEKGIKITKNAKVIVK